MGLGLIARLAGSFVPALGVEFVEAEFALPPVAPVLGAGFEGVLGLVVVAVPACFSELKSLA